MIERKEVIKIFKKNNALLNGHFRLSSGFHSDTYFQSALILQYPKKAYKLIKNIVKQIKQHNIKINCVIAPAIGGIIVGYEIGRILNVRSMFTERVNGKVCLKRNFLINKKERILISEDVITTGLSIKEVMTVIKSYDAKVVAIAALVDRSTKKINFGVPKFSLLNLKIKNYEEKKCPMCKKGSIAIQPGSRNQ
ncbi:MAG: orotate phosphoribosyltransferase [Endomicrobium sp.]|jgi:orotate phosphoribosyltransferase|nr:orotate phosphoribosyltransferase [Endomicrobium sp.]